MSPARDLDRDINPGNAGYLQISPPVTTPHNGRGSGAVGLEQAVTTAAAIVRTAKVILLRSMLLPREGDGGGERLDRS